ncbi:MAG TPA: hypothetical protein VGB28_03680 [Actinomycetota bacterium]|jgi:hypothetical protein
MYATSLVLLLVGVACLALGFQRENLILVFASIAASVLSMLFLGVSVLRRRAVQDAERRAMAPWTPAPVDEEVPAVHDVPEEDDQATEPA